MKFLTLIPLAAIAMAANVQAQGQVWRCSGNNYTNVASEAKAKGCKLVEGGNVTVVEGTRVSSGNGSSAVKLASAPTRVESSEQKARDADARIILEAELKKAETRQAELLKEYNNGEPEKMGPEHKNYQKYLDRVADLKASIARNESDIAGLKRELGRVGGTVPASK